MDGNKIMANIQRTQAELARKVARVNTPLAMAAAMAVAGDKMPESAKIMAMGLAHKPRLTPKPNRNQRRAMAAKLSHTTNTTGSKLVRKARQGKL